MPIHSWAELQSHVRTRYRLQRDEANYFVMGWQIEAPSPAAGPSRSPVDALIAEQAALGSPLPVQGVHVQLLTAQERSFAVLRAEVCSERALAPREALLHGTRLLVGALVLSGNHYVLRYALPLGAVQEADIDFALQYIAREAAVLRGRATQLVAAPEARAKAQWSE